MKLLDIGDRKYYQSANDTYETPNSDFSMQRFGDGTGRLYFALRSHCRRYDEAIVFIGLEALGIAGEKLKPVELVEGRGLVWDVHDGMMRIVVPITFLETLVLSIKKQK